MLFGLKPFYITWQRRETEGLLSWTEPEPRTFTWCIHGCRRLPDCATWPGLWTNVEPRTHGKCLYLIMNEVFQRFLIGLKNEERHISLFPFSDFFPRLRFAKLLNRISMVWFQKNVYKLCFSTCNHNRLIRVFFIRKWPSVFFFSWKAK